MISIAAEEKEQLANGQKTRAVNFTACLGKLALPVALLLNTGSVSQWNRQ